MSDPRAQRRLAAIIASDVVDYSKMMGHDEAGTLSRLKSLRKEFLHPKVEEYGGRIVKTAGDGTLIEFPSAVDAVSHAIDVQRGMAARNDALPEDRRIMVRMGINIGDIIIDQDDIYGDGVNIAARLETLAEPGGICLSAIVNESVGNRVDVAFADGGEVMVKNIDRPIHVWKWKPDNNAEAAPVVLKHASIVAGRPSPEKPSLAVLPFNNMSGDPEQEYFADGLVEDIITTLSKLAGLRVIARNSSFVYKGLAIDIREAAKQLGVRYVLEGSIRRAGNRIRITAQLIDSKDGSHVWAERYDRAMDDIFAVQDEITLIVATEMQVKLTEGEQARLHYRTASNVEAWTHWVKGLHSFRLAITKENTGEALRHWEKALILDPDSASLNAMLGFLHYVDARFGWRDDRQTAIGKARNYADRALELDPENADANTTLSLAMLLEGRFETAADYARNAVDLAPSSADAATLACFVLAFAGYAEEAVRQGERALNLSPNYPGYYLGHLGNAYRLAGQYEKAIAAFKAYHARSAGFGLVDLVLVYQRTDRTEEARRAAKQLMSIRPEFTIASWADTQFRADKSEFERDVYALRDAGLPVG